MNFDVFLKLGSPGKLKVERIPRIGLGVVVVGSGGVVVWLGLYVWRDSSTTNGLCNERQTSRHVLTPTGLFVISVSVH